MKRILVFPVLLTLLFGIPAVADFNAGFEALERGDYATALNEFKPLAEQGDSWAQNNLGWMYQKGLGVIQDYETAVKWYQLAAEQGVAHAQVNLGWMYDEGLGVPQDYEEAVKWFKLAAEQGNAIAQIYLGFMYVKDEFLDIIKVYKAVTYSV